MNKQKTTIIKTLPILAMLAIILFTVQVYASGVAMPYWTGPPGNENPLVIAKGESKTINIELQNGIGTSDINFKVTIESTDNIASLVENKDSYAVPAGTSTQVPIKVSAPSIAGDGSVYKVKVTVQEIKTSTSGQFSLSSAFESKFDVIVGQPKPATSPANPSLLTTNTLIYLVIAIVIIAGIIFWFKKRKKAN